MTEYGNEELNLLRQTAEQTADTLYRNDIESAQQKIAEILPAAAQIYREMIGQTGAYAQMGVEIPAQVLFSQLQNIEEAVENRDFMLLADTLKYEIAAGLLFYSEVKDMIQHE